MKKKGLSSKGSLMIGALCLSGFFSFAFAEVSLRVLGVSYPVFHRYDPIRGKALVPGKEGWFRSEGEAYVRINSAGFRDVEHALEKPEGTYRIAILGDSYMEARQVSLEHMFGQRLEEYLRSCDTKTYQKIETLSFGQGGYSTTDELLTLKHHVWPYNPDMVLTAIFHGNDLVDNFPKINNCVSGGCPDIRRPYFYLDEEKQWKLDNSFRNLTFASFTKRTLLLGVQYSRTLELINQTMRVINSWRIQRNDEVAFLETGLSEWVYAPPRLPLHHEAWAITEGILDLLNQEVKHHQAQSFWMLVTNPSQVDPVQRRELKVKLGVDALDYPEQRFMKLGKKLGVPVVPLVYAFQDYVDERQVYLHGFPNTRMGAGHWNEKGHDLAASVLADNICVYLKSKGTR